MGRTKRIRRRNKMIRRNRSLDCEPAIVNLKKWLVKSGWNDENHLKLQHFEGTGRGVASTKTMNVGDNLITIPYDLMITYTTIQTSGLFDMLPPTEKLTMHDLLTLFLMVEKHKGDKSCWVDYIQTLPAENPMLPWLCSEENFTLFPDELKSTAEKVRYDFKQSRKRLQKSINATCCLERKTPQDCVIKENLFTWAYILVNTRAVYVDPQVVCKLVDKSPLDFLSDSPCMALCSYLDMFNHHYSAKTNAKLTLNQGKLCYQLQTFTAYHKYKQIFISYGAHDNIKLLVEYGFFIPGNKFDCVKFTSGEVIKILHIVFDERQFKFIRDHNFDQDLYIGPAGISFNLKAFLYVSFHSGVRNFSNAIYSDCYSDEFNRTMFNCSKMLLTYKHKLAMQDLNTFETHSVDTTANLELLKDFLRYRIVFINELLDAYVNK